MEPALPMAPHDLDVFDEVVTVAFDVTPGDVAALAVAFHGDDAHPTHVDTYPLPDVTGPVYVALADGTIIRWHPQPPTAADALTVVYAGHGLQGHDVPAVFGDDPPVAGRVAVQGQLLRPSVLLPESPATPHAFRHRAHRLRTCRAVRWWPGLADEYQALLPDGWQLSQEGDVRWAVVNTDGDYVDLTGTDYLLMEDGTTTVVTGSQRSLFALWQQITGPDAAPAPPPPPTSPDPAAAADDVTSTAAAAGITTDDTP